MTKEALKYEFLNSFRNLFFSGTRFDFNCGQSNLLYRPGLNSTPPFTENSPVSPVKVILHKYQLFWRLCTYTPIWLAKSGGRIGLLVMR
jgi:hypothetical protein